MFFPSPISSLKCHQNHSYEASGANEHQHGSLSNSPGVSPKGRSHSGWVESWAKCWNSSEEGDPVSTFKKLRKAISQRFSLKRTIFEATPVPASFGESAWFPHQKKYILWRTDIEIWFGQGFKAWSIFLGNPLEIKLNLLWSSLGLNLWTWSLDAVELIHIIQTENLTQFLKSWNHMVKERINYLWLQSLSPRLKISLKTSPKQTWNISFPRQHHLKMVIDPAVDD